jgi:hypothetical protein
VSYDKHLLRLGLELPHAAVVIQKKTAAIAVQSAAHSWPSRSSMWSRPMFYVLVEFEVLVLVLVASC